MVTLTALKILAKAGMPHLAALRRMIRAPIYDLLLRTTSYRRRVFESIYVERKSIGERVSGPGSDPTQTAVITQEIPKLVKELGIKTLIDAPCGDFSWMQGIDLQAVQYIGIDIVEEIIQRNQRIYGSMRRRFVQLDLISEALPRGDLVLCRDCLVHLSYRDTLAAIENFKRSGSQYLLTTTFLEHRSNTNGATGNWRPLNLQLPPFRFPKPRYTISEACTEFDGRCADKCLALWELVDLPR